MDVVEAIDAWIDEQIDDLSDDELATILEILDVVAASRFAELDVSAVFDDDVDELVALVGGSSDNRTYTESLLVAAVYDDPALDDERAINEADVALLLDGHGHAIDAGPDDDQRAINEADIALLFDGHGHAIDAGPDDDERAINEADVALSLEGHDGDGDGESGDTDDERAINEADVALSLDGNDGDGDGDGDGESGDTDTSDTSDTEVSDRGHSDSADFLAELAEAQSAYLPFDDTEERAPSLLERALPLVELRPFDTLGPSFLSESSARPPRRKAKGVGRFLLPVIMVACLGVFAYGMVQLIDSLNSDGQQVASTGAATPDPEATTAPEATSAPSAVPAMAAPSDPAAPTPTPAPAPAPPPRLAIRLVNGDVMLATWAERGSPPEISTIYDASDDGLSPARELAWLSTGVGIIDNDGNVVVVDPDARNPEASVIYEVNGGIEAAVEIAAVLDLVAIRTESGNIVLTSSGERADPDILTVVWDAEEGGAAATDISSVGDLIPFVLDDGDARMVVTSADNDVVTLWLAGEQPRAFNVSASSKGVLLGIGEGAVARYRLGDIEGSRLESVWDPFSSDEQPAISYSSAGNRTAIVLGDGAIVLADDTGTGARVWDPADTEIRAFSAAGDSSQVVVLLETGSVVRIPLDPDELIESVWDITDETLIPANEVAVEPGND